MEQHMEQQATEQQQGTASSLTFRDLVAMAIVLGCIPALVLTVVFWAVATAFPQAGALPSIMGLLITLLMSLIGIILIVRYVDSAVLNMRRSSAAPSGSNASEEHLTASLGAGIVCAFLAIALVVCLTMAGTLEGWHATLMAVEVLLVGYQTWRTFLGRRED